MSDQHQPSQQQSQHRQQRRYEHKHREHDNFFDPNNPIFDRATSGEERIKQIMALTGIGVAIIFLLWFFLG